MTVLAKTDPRISAAAVSLRALAHKCRAQAAGGGMESGAAALNEMAFDYDRQADRADRAEARARNLLAARGPAGDPPAADG